MLDLMWTKLGVIFKVLLWYIFFFLCNPFSCVISILKKLWHLPAKLVYINQCFYFCILCLQVCLGMFSESNCSLVLDLYVALSYKKILEFRCFVKCTLDICRKKEQSFVLICHKWKEINNWLPQNNFFIFLYFEF